MPILVATDREVVVIDVERRHLRAGARNQRPPHVPRCGRAGSRAGVVWHPPGRRVQERRWRTVLAVSRPCGPADYGRRCEPGRAGRRVGGHRAERSVALGGRWRYVGADQPLGDIVLVVGMVLSAETGHSSRSLDCVPPARTRTTLGRDRGRRARVHDRRRPHMARPRHWWTVGHPRARRSSQRSRYPARLRGRWIFRERRCRRDVALAEHGSRGRLLAQRGD